MSETLLGQHIDIVNNLQGTMISYHPNAPTDYNLSIFKDIDEDKTYILSNNGFSSIELTHKELKNIVAVLEKLAIMLRRGTTYSINNEILLFTNDPNKTHINNVLTISIDNNTHMTPELKLEIIDRFSHYMHSTLFLDIKRNNELLRLFSSALTMEE